MRARILNVLRHRRELTAPDIAAMFGLQRTELNRHIKLLERAHLISSRRVGLIRQFRFMNELTPYHDKLIDFLCSLEELAEVKADLTRDG